MSVLIDRLHYLKQLIDNKDINLIKIVTGIRRSGKSSIIDLYHDYLFNNGVNKENVIHMNLESLKYRDLTDYISFYDYVKGFIPLKDKTYLLFDEVQVIKEWEAIEF